MMKKNTQTLVDVLNQNFSEKYFSCDLGFYLYVLKSPIANLVDSSRPTLVQVYNDAGTKISENIKRYESNAAFCLTFSDEFRKSNFYEISKFPKKIKFDNEGKLSLIPPTLFDAPISSF